MVNLPSNRLLPAILALAVLSIQPWGTPAWADQPAMERYGGRDMIVYVPSGLPPSGSRALVVVLHGGLGNAERIASQRSESGLNMNAVADRNGFIVAYLNGTPVTRLGGQMLGWNAGGGCCGQSAQNNIDDVAYITGAVSHLAPEYGIDSTRVYGMGHSNGAMMSQRLVCETSLFAAAVAIFGPLNLDTAHCAGAQGKRILAIHGADDQNVPITGGRGNKGLARVAFSSEEHARQVLTASGATYTLQVVPGADHMLEHIDAVIQQTEGITSAEKAARFFGLAAPQ